MQRFRFACTQKIRVPGRSPPPLPSFTRGERALATHSENQQDELKCLKPSVKGVAGGVPPP